MSPNVSGKPLVLEPVPSRLLLAYKILLHALALLSVLMLIRLSLLMKALGATAIGVSLLFTYIRSKRRQNPSKLVWREDGVWSCYFADGTEDSATLAQDSYVSRYLVVLRLLATRGKINLPLLADSLDEESLRRLRVRLNQTRLADKDLSAEK